jgi:hypothetical protein
MNSLPSSFYLARLLRLLRNGAWVIGCAMAFEVWAQSSSTLPPQVVTNDPALTSPQAQAEEEEGVTITPDDRSTSIRTYGPGGRPSREVVDPPLLPEYSVSAPAEPQSVMPDADPVRGDMVQPPMWTLWSW